MLLIFAATLILMSMVFFLFLILRKASPRLTEKDFQTTLTQAISGNLTTDEWLVFLSMPIQHDPWLEAVRQKLFQIDEDYSIRSVVSAELPKCMFSREGLELLKEVQQNIPKRPYREF